MNNQAGPAVPWVSCFTHLKLLVISLAQCSCLHYSPHLGESLAKCCTYNRSRLRIPGIHLRSVGEILAFHFSKSCALFSKCSNAKCLFLLAWLQFGYQRILAYLCIRFLVVCEWFNLHSLVSCFYCFGSQIASMCTCLCKTCRNISELLAQDLRECSSRMEQVAVYAASAVYRLCDVSGRLSSPNKAWERQPGTQQCCIICLDGGGRVWRWDPDQTNPPVTHQVPGSSVIPAEADSAKKQKKNQHDFWPHGSSVESLCYSSYEKSRFLYLEGNILGDTEHRVSSLEWGRLIPYLKKAWKSSVVVGINPSASLLKEAQRRWEGCWLRYVAFPSISLKPWSCFPRRIVTPGLPSLDSCQAHRVSRQATWLLLLSVGGELGL